MTTEERITELEQGASDAFDRLRFIAKEEGYADTDRVAIALSAVSMELRALRLMLREEIREAAWRLAAPKADYDPERIQRNAMEWLAKNMDKVPYDQDAVPEKLHEAVVDGKDVP